MKIPKMSHYEFFFFAAGSDYITSTVMFTFRPSQTPALCGNVPIIDDSIGLEPNELFSVRITSVSGANVMIGDQDESCVEIIDNDGMSYVINPRRMRERGLQ